MSRAIIDLTGQVFGKWFVLRPDPEKPKHWICRCSACNREYPVSGNSLRQGRTTQCRSCAGKGRLVPTGGPEGRAKALLAAGRAARVKHGLPPLAPGQESLRNRMRLGYPVIRSLCETAEREGWDATKIIAELRKLST